MVTWVLISIFFFSDKAAVSMPATYHETLEICEEQRKKLSKDFTIKQGSGFLAPTKGYVQTSCIRSLK